MIFKGSRRNIAYPQSHRYHFGSNQPIIALIIIEMYAIAILTVSIRVNNQFYGIFYQAAAIR